MGGSVLRIDLLGPLQVTLDGAAVTPSAPKIRRVFSLFALCANHIVRTEQLIEELWEENPPSSVKTTLQTYVYQLRKSLCLDAAQRPRGRGAAAGDQPVLLTLTGGYLLSVDPEVLDANRFDREAQRGWAELDAGDPEAAFRTLDDALGLWRGPALVDVNPGPLLQAEALRLDEMRKNALEHRIDAALRLGRHQEVLGELTRLAAQQPTHEGFQAKLMLAFYRSGRRSEALHVYQRTRAALAQELGLDPSAELQRVHRAVLAANGSLDRRTGPAPAQQARPARPEPPRQLPSAGPQLVGRSAELEAVLAGLRPADRHGPAVVAVEGPPGAGKSALCVHAGHEVRDRYPDGQFHAVLADGEGRPLEPGDVLAEFLRAVGIPAAQIPDSVDERSRWFRTWTADRQVLVVLDDLVEDSQLAPLVPAGRECGVVIASRRRLSDPGVATTVQLRPLGPADSARLLVNLIEADRGDEALEDARRLAAPCDGLPLALHTVATRLRLRPHWSMHRMLAWSDLTGQPGTAGDDPLGLQTSVARSCRTAREDARRAFLELSVLDTPEVRLPDVAAVFELDGSRAEALLDELANLHLLSVERCGDELRYRLLPSFRAAGRWLIAEEDELALAAVCD
ncbi:AfsR/SARP family transcriptional regulator [Amycolatopsis circi]|uniref:AfsR/SARP family transcriptional regulator n=1 Tax=Amycolatopsis circi TaxID=871959 RepID=UPI000E249759|nr:AfsR/SARP family transcriptional regulator [Amycolatopsis circi]